MSSLNVTRYRHVITFLNPSSYDDIYLDYLPLSQKITEETYNYSLQTSKLFIKDSAGNNIPAFSWYGGDLFAISEDSQKNIYATVENYSTVSNPCAGGVDIMIYKVFNGIPQNGFCLFEWHASAVWTAARHRVKSIGDGENSSE